MIVCCVVQLSLKGKSWALSPIEVIVTVSFCPSLPYCKNLKDFSFATTDIVTDNQKPFCKGHVLTVRWCFEDRF